MIRRLVNMLAPRPVQVPARFALADKLRRMAHDAAAQGYDFHGYRLHALADAAEAMLSGDKAGAYYALGWAAHYRDAAPSPSLQVAA